MLKIYAWLAAVALVTLSATLINEHGKRVAREKDIEASNELIGKLRMEYAIKEKDWNDKLDIAAGKAATAEAEVARLAATAPTLRVVRQSCAALASTPAVPAAGSGTAGHADSPTANGVLPDAPNSGTGKSGVYDAGPALRQDALMCDRMSTQLDYWIDRYQATETHP
jgi:hypothetical protein